MDGMPKSFRPLKVVEDPKMPRPDGASKTYLEREDGTGVWLTNGVTDKADGVTDADFDFDEGKAWAEAHSDD